MISVFFSLTVKETCVLSMNLRNFRKLFFIFYLKFKRLCEPSDITDMFNFFYEDPDRLLLGQLKMFM